MKGRDLNDVVGGVGIAALGAAFLVPALRYDLGTVADIGPGFFPSLLGAGLCLVGVLISVAAWFRAGALPAVEWRSAAFVLASPLLFALTVRHAGLVASTFVTFILASMAQRDMSWRARIVAAVVATALVYGVFVIGLRISLPAWWW